jgi:hypothetical protein
MEYIAEVRTRKAGSQKTNRDSNLDHVRYDDVFSQLRVACFGTPGSNATPLTNNNAVSRYNALSMLPVCVLIRPITHGLTIPLVMPMLVVDAAERVVR